MGRRQENTGFSCARCGSQVRPLTNGSYRNHCPVCLWSRHVDTKPGDRANPCRGMMEPVGVRLRKKGPQLVHRCLSCGQVRANRTAAQTVQPDDFDRILELMEVAAVVARSQS